MSSGGRAVKFLNYIVTYIATRDVRARIRDRGEGDDEGLRSPVALRAPDPRPDSFFLPLPPPLFFSLFLALSAALRGGARRARTRREDAGGGNAEKFITARAAARWPILF